jgi:hypothetical protein
LLETTELLKKSLTTEIVFFRTLLDQFHVSPLALPILFWKKKHGKSPGFAGEIHELSFFSRKMTRFFSCMAMENHPFIDDFPMKSSIFHGISHGFSQKKAVSPPGPDSSPAAAS